ncbi:MAG: hypothetical protein ACKOU7_11065 [Ferruginibacter sp.]
MNQKLQQLLDSIQKSAQLSDDEKNALIRSVLEVDKEIEITAFKLDRTEKVKRTTAILLEETIEELEQKRKAVEAQNHELQIESALERVRTVAMGMHKQDDLMNICQAVYAELQALGFTELRNTLIDTFVDEEKYFIDYDYSEFSGGSSSRIPYSGNPVVEKYITDIRKSGDAFFEITVEGAELEAWKKFRRDNGELEDSRLNDLQALFYYKYSIGPGSIGISTYSRISPEKLNILHRFRNVFNLAHQRYADITKAEAQAYEARIESSLERVRAQAMAMRTPEELTGICEVLYTELNSLGFTEIRNAMINIHDDEKETFVNYDYSDEIGKSINHLHYSIHPLIEKQIKQIRSGDGFSETSYTGKDLEDMITFRKNIGEKDDPRIEKADALYYYFYSIGTGSIGISTFNRVAGEKLNVLKRFRNVFTLAYQRYTDLALAEAQAREAEIELALERVRARTMAMQHSDELADASFLLDSQVRALGIKTRGCAFNIYGDHESTEWFSSEAGTMPPYKTPRENIFLEYYEAGHAGEAMHIHTFEGDACAAHYDYLCTLPVAGESLKKFRENGGSFPASQTDHVTYFKYGYLLFITLEPVPEVHDIFKRFAKVFENIMCFGYRF